MGNSLIAGDYSQLGSLRLARDQAATNAMFQDEANRARAVDMANQIVARQQAQDEANQRGDMMQASDLRNYELAKQNQDFQQQYSNKYLDIMSGKSRTPEFTTFLNLVNTGGVGPDEVNAAVASKWFDDAQNLALKSALEAHYRTAAGQLDERNAIMGPVEQEPAVLEAERQMTAGKPNAFGNTYRYVFGGQAPDYLGPARDLFNNPTMTEDQAKSAIDLKKKQILASKAYLQKMNPTQLAQLQQSRFAPWVMQRYQGEKAGTQAGTAGTAATRYVISGGPTSAPSLSPLTAQATTPAAPAPVATFFGMPSARVGALPLPTSMPRTTPRFPGDWPSTSFANEADARAAGYKDGDVVTIGGRKGRLTPTY